MKLKVTVTAVRMYEAKDFGLEKLEFKDVKKIIETDEIYFDCTLHLEDARTQVIVTAEQIND